MARKKRLLWQLYPSYLVITLLSLLAVSWYASRSFRQFCLDRIEADLEARARLAAKILVTKQTDREAARIDALCKKTGEEISTRITLIETTGRVVADSEEDPSRMDNHADRPEIQRAMAGKIGSSTRYSYTLQQDMMYVAVPVLEKGKVARVVRASMPVTAISRALKSIYTQIGLAGVIVAVLAALISFLVSRRINRPLDEMKRGAVRFAAGDLDHRLGVPDSEEIGALAEAMNRMASDLDERIRTITSQRSELEAVLSGMVEAVLVVDKGERIMRFNSAARKLLGFENEDIRGRSIQEAVRNPDLHDLLKRTLKGPGPVEGDITLRNGGERYLHGAGALLKGAGGSTIGAVIVLHDVTGMTKMENMRREFVANVSHELKTPITTIKGYVETLRDGALADTANVEIFLGIVSNHADRLNAIVEDLLSLSRIEKEEEMGRLPLEKALLKGVLDSAVELHEGRAAKKNITIHVSCDENISAEINPEYFQQAVSNLLDNAVIYSDPGRKVDIRVERENGQIAVKVADSGCGIPGDHLPRIFERFYRVDRERSRESGGTGLGLAIVKHIIQAHGGRVDVESA
ncbi:MAG: ATP-binding protein, partial [Pseudomonadota bacterium]